MWPRPAALLFSLDENFESSRTYRVHDGFVVAFALIRVGNGEVRDGFDTGLGKRTYTKKG